jgi:hypothetical protein
VSDGSRIRTDEDLDGDGAGAGAGLRGRRRLYRTSSTAVAAVIGLVMIDASALVDVVGVDTVETSRAAPDGRTLVVEFPSVTRPALASPWRITVDGLDPGERVVLGIDRHYLAMWDHNAVFPVPEAERSVEPWVVWEYVASSSRLVVELDLRLEPAVQWGRTGHVALLDDRDEPIVVADLHTRVMP